MEINLWKQDRLHQEQSLEGQPLMLCRRVKHLSFLVFPVRCVWSRDSLVFLWVSPLVGLNGGSGRNRTGVDGFAIRCITTLPPSHRGARAPKKREVYRLRLVCHYGLRVLTREATLIIPLRAHCMSNPLILSTSCRVLRGDFGGIDA